MPVCIGVHLGTVISVEKGENYIVCNILMFFCMPRDNNIGAENGLAASVVITTRAYT